MTAFKTYDIRGIWGTELDARLVYRIGYFLPRILPADKVLVGRDIRLSSNEMFEALSAGLNDAGVDVMDAGLSTTPMIYWGSGKYGYQASVMITASHNSKEYNGLKFSGPDVMPIGYDNGLQQLKLLTETEQIVPSPDRGVVRSVDLKDAYLQFLQAYLSDVSSLNIAIDCSDGMAGLFATNLFGEDLRIINSKPDGRFPAHKPNPLDPANQHQIKSLVLDHGCDIGLIFDGDADRVMFIDEQGGFVSPDLIIALLGHYFFEERQEKGWVVQDIRSSKAVAEYLSQFDVDVATWRVGRAYGAVKLKELDGIYGGELAGHYYFRDFYYSDSGLLAAILVLGIVKKFKDRGLPLSFLMKKIGTYFNTGEVNFQLAHKQEAMDAIRDYFMAQDPPVKFLDFDGYRMEFESWWFNVRPSNTEPYLRFLAEAKTEQLLQEKTSIIYEIIRQYK